MQRHDAASLTRSGFISPTMEQDSLGQSQRLDEEDFNVGGARNISKLEKLETARTQTTTSRSVTTDGHPGAVHYISGDDSMPRSSSSEILIDDSQLQRTSATAEKSDDWRSKKKQQHWDTIEQRSGKQLQRYDEDDRRSAAGEKYSDAKEQTYSTQSMSRRERNAAAAEMAYRMVGLPSDTEYSQASKRSKAVNSGGRSKPHDGLSGLEDTTDMIVENAMEEAIEALYGKKRRRKMMSGLKTSSTGETKSLDRHDRTLTTMDRRANSGCDATLSDDRALARRINETTSRDESRKKAVSYLRVLKDHEDIEEDLDMHRPASADGRLTNRVDYAAHRRVQAARRQPCATSSRSRYQTSYTSPPMSRYQRQTATNLLSSQRVNGYSSETELIQSSRRPDRRQYFSGDDSDFSTTVEIKNPRSTQFQSDNGGYTSDDSETRNLQYTSPQSRVPTLTKGMVTKILYGDRPRSPTMFVSEVRPPDVQSTVSPVQFTASPSSSINVFSSPSVYRGNHLSAVVPVGTATESRWTYRPSAVDDNFLLQRAPAYQQSRMDAAQCFARQTAVYGPSRTGRSTPSSLQATIENDERPSCSYAAFSNEPIIVANLDDDHTTKMMSMRRAQSLFALDEMSPVSTGITRSQTPTYSSRPDISMTNRQVLNLYLFNRRAPGDGVKGRSAEMETITQSMTFGEEIQRIARNKQTQTPTSPPVHRETTRHVTQQRNVEKLTSPKTKHSSKYSQTDVPPKPAQRRKPTPSRVTEETVIVKPSITETRETEMFGDVFADRRQLSSEEPENPAVRTIRSLVTSARKEPHQEEPAEETLETTVVEEKEQRIEMTIREDLEFSLQRAKGTANDVTASTDVGKVEPWWIPDKFEAFVERKRQKITQTKDIGNKDDHSKRIDIERNARDSSETGDAFESNNPDSNSDYETNFDKQSTSRNQRETDRNVRIPVFLESRYNSPLHGMTSPSSNLVRTKMATHSEPELNLRHQYYMAKRDKYYGSLFDDSRRKPPITGNSDNENSSFVMPSHSNRRQQQKSSTDVLEHRLEVADGYEGSDDSNSAAQEPHSATTRYVSTYSQYISPPSSSGGNVAPTAGNDDLNISRSNTGARSSYQPATSGTYAVFPSSNIITLPNVTPRNGDGETHEHDDGQFPESLNDFDRVLTEIEEELPPPPPPLPTPSSSGNHQSQNTSTPASTSQRLYATKSSTTPSSDVLLVHKKSKPQPPEKSWKRSEPLPLKSRKLYSSKHHPVAATVNSAPATRQKATGPDFRCELGDRSYVSLSLTEPDKREDQRRRIAVVTQEHAEPGGFTYGWTTEEQKKRKHHPQPGSYQLRHSRWTSQDYETAATAF